MIFNEVASPNRAVIAASNAKRIKSVEIASHPVRVVHVGPALNVRGGVSSVERLIVRELGSRLDIQHVATMHEGSVLSKGWTFLRALRQLRVELGRAVQQPIVHVHFASRGSTWRKLIVSMLVLRAKAPLVLHAHGGGFEAFYGRLPKVLQTFIRNIFRRADLFVVLSEYWRDFYVQQLGVDPGRVKVMWNPTRVPTSVPDRRGRNDVHVLYLGLVSDSKGTFDLLRAVIALPPPLLNRVRLTVAGNGELARLEEIAAALNGRVTIRSWVSESERDRLLSEADLFVLPSYREGVPMSILEAMSFGLPVLSTTVGGIPEIVAHEHSGLLIAPGNHAELVAQLSRLIADESLRARLGAQAYEAARRFDVRAYGDELSRSYLALIPR
jgi:glycosyltransferase involved in cell wall biosynthesis